MQQAFQVAATLIYKGEKPVRDYAFDAELRGFEVRDHMDIAV